MQMNSPSSYESDETLLDEGANSDAQDAFPDPIPWPQAGDRALLPGNWQMNACMPGQWATDRWYGYVEGYRRAATILLEHVQERRSDADVLVYPLVFLWRQHVELQLKRVISFGRELSPDAGSLSYPKHHRLDELWRDAREHILREEPNVSSECQAVTTIIAEVARLDPDSFEFRYPESKSGARTLADVGPHLNLETLHEAFLKTANFLGCAVHELSSRVDHVREYERERRAECDSERRDEYACEARDAYGDPDRDDGTR